MATRVILTYADYAAIPADGRRYELLEGEVSVTSAPSPTHQEVLGSLFALLRDHVKSRGLGKVFPSPIDCMLSDTTIVQPDIVYVASGSLPAIGRRGIEGPPTLVVEVLSPSTIQIDRGVKFQLYARHGVPHYWIVDPEARSIEAYRLAEGAYELSGRLEKTRPLALAPFPDLVLDPASLWP